jgi:hypothetical protein
LSDLYKKYLAAMERLPIDNPTEDDFIAICPHLTPEEALASFIPTEGKSTAYVATPAVRVIGSFFVVEYWKGIGDTPPRLDISWSTNVRDGSFVRQTPDGIILPLHYKEAAFYAIYNWPELLIRKSWTSYGDFYLMDPNNPTGTGGPAVVTKIGCTTRRTLDGILNDPSLPISVTMDTEIVELTLNEVVATELRGRLTSFSGGNYCSRCGHGLGITKCNGCNVRYGDDTIRIGWWTPLPRKIFGLLKATGHEFVVDPEIAWQDEKSTWEEKYIKT